LEVGGRVTEKQLENLISQTEYTLAVTPIYDEGAGQPMTGSAITDFDCFPDQAILNSDETTHVMEDLEPDTPYDVQVTAIYPDESESEDLMGTERTLPRAPPTNLVVYNETTTTLNARWTPPSGRVQNYRITYVPTAGGRSQTVSPDTITNSVPGIFKMCC
ncbi:hypothetical protein XENOCAPTIV_029712, partial [Xenoophorus captivus]